MKRIIFLVLVLSCCIATIGQNNKKLIVGNWLVERFEMEGKELFNRSNKTAVFANYKNMALGDTAVLSETDSLAIAETIRESEKIMGSISMSFDAKGNHTASSLDSKAKKMTVSKGIYKFAPGDDTKLMIKMGKPSNPFETSIIVELTATTITFTEATEDPDTPPLKMTFKRIPAAAVKKPVKR
jgi:hypothetical protein